MSDLKSDLQTLRSNINHAAESAEEGGRETTASVLDSFADDVEVLIQKHTEDEQ